MSAIPGGSAWPKGSSPRSVVSSARELPAEPRGTYYGGNQMG
jgi:hypothetical protein